MLIKIQIAERLHKKFWVYLRWDLRFCHSNKLPVMLRLLVQRQDFENHCSVWFIRGFPHRTSEPQWPTHSNWLFKTIFIYFSPFLISFFPILSLWDPEYISNKRLAANSVPHTQLSEELSLRQGQYWLLSGFLKQPPKWSTCCPTWIHSAHSGRKDPSKTTMDDCDFPA